MQIVYEMGRTKDTHAVLCLEENVVTGAADGYAEWRSAPRPDPPHAACAHTARRRQAF
jgi:acetolactate synthase-1/2/3 large subunit